MVVELKALGGLELTDDLSEFSRTRVIEPLRRLYDKQGTSLEIELSDLYGPKGGIDKRCRLTFSMPNKQSITVTEVAENIYKAIDGASSRFLRLVNRHKQWKLVKTRYPTKYYAAEQEHLNQPGETFTPADITVEEDSLAAREERLRREREGADTAR